MTSLVPKKLESDRLILRQFQESDWVGLHEYYCDPAATQYTVGKSFTEGETWRAMSSMIGHWQLKGYGPYAVVEKETDRVLGPVGFWFPNDWPSPEIKWGLARRYWGKGFASEAAREVLIAAHKHMPEISLISLIHRNNQASINLAIALGASLESEIEFRGSTFYKYRHRSIK